MKGQAMGQMHEHFAKLSSSYNVVRTTDVEPILYIRDKLQDRKRIGGADIGCGGGRYDLLLLQHVPGLNLICSDVNEAMVKATARFLRSNGQTNFSVQCVNATDLRLPKDALDCIFTFNAVHHFNPVAFLNQSAKALRKAGYIFVYTRLRSQNARTIWGRFFPGFLEKETRLYDLGQIERWADELESIRLETIEFFRFRRVAPLQHLVIQAENKHYSTFSLYSVGEFSKALSEFKQRIKRYFNDLSQITWVDENVMVVFRKD